MSIEDLTQASLARVPYQFGLHGIGRGVYAYTQPDGGWSLSNAGLVVDGGEALLVDTLFDLPLTAAMLDSMRRAEPVAANKIGRVVNTHANPDHTNGNMLLEDAEIIASVKTAKGMRALKPEVVARMVENARAHVDHDPTARYIVSIFGRFQLDGIHEKLPTREFEGKLELTLGDTKLEVIELGAAHTDSDVVVYVPRARVVFTGDILFIGGHPMLWAGPVSNWIAACDRLLALDIDLVVPGHGPVTDRRGVQAMRDYFSLVEGLAVEQYRDGAPASAAARAIHRSLEGSAYRTWGEAERLVATVGGIYRALSNTAADANPAAVFPEMAAFAHALEQRKA